VRQGVTITVSGAGACSYRLDYGDGNGEDRSTSFPDRVHHVYNAPGPYTIVVTGTGACRGRAERTLDVR
jgi:PKD repeat protein